MTKQLRIGDKVKTLSTAGVHGGLTGVVEAKLRNGARQLLLAVRVTDGRLVDLHHRHVRHCEVK